MSSNREQIDQVLEQINKGKTPEQIMQESYEYTRAQIQASKDREAQTVKDRVKAMRALFNSTLPSKLKNR